MLGLPQAESMDVTPMDLTGVFVPLVTPFDADGEVSTSALESLAHEVLDDGVAGLVALGTTAEPESLSTGERSVVVDTLARVCGGRGAQLIVGAPHVRAVRALANRPAVTAALAVVPPFVRAGEEGVVAHFRALAQASPVPLVIYHVPYRTAQELSPATLCRLAGLSTVAGMKYSAGRIDAGTVAFLGERPAGFAVLGGDDAILSPLLALGAEGGILASAHLATSGFVHLVKAWRADDVGAARRLAGPLAALSAAVFVEPNPTVLKGALHACGRIPTPSVRLPLLPAGNESVHTAMARLAEVAPGGSTR
jgi:4-hydroxy-tetrahydrodipicolinate synthase